MRKVAPPNDEGEHIEAVLQAERDADAAVERARQEAEAELASAREQTRAIRERTAQRVTRLHAGTSVAIERRVAELRAEEADALRQLSRRSADPSVVGRAAERVADWLLGGAR